MSTRRKIIQYILGTWFGSGLIPPILFRGMAGTYGSFFAIPACAFALEAASGLGSPWGALAAYLLACGLIFLVGCWCVGPTERLLGPRADWRGSVRTRDQNQIVIDEVLGMFIATAPILFIPIRSWPWALIIAFLLFRFFDIVKPPPTRYFDRMKNAAGVMLDDVVAGAYAAACLALAPLLR